jgi:hypothetical protein
MNYIFAIVTYFVVIGFSYLSVYLFGGDVNHMIGFSALMVACIALFKEVK